MGQKRGHDQNLRAVPEQNCGLLERCDVGPLDPGALFEPRRHYDRTRGYG